MNLCVNIEFEHLLNLFFYVCIFISKFWLICFLRIEWWFEFFVAINQNQYMHLIYYFLHYYNSPLIQSLRWLLLIRLCNRNISYSCFGCIDEFSYIVIHSLNSYFLWYTWTILVRSLILILQHYEKCWLQNTKMILNDSSKI